MSYTETIQIKYTIIGTDHVSLHFNFPKFILLLGFNRMVYHLRSTDWPWSAQRKNEEEHQDGISSIILPSPHGKIDIQMLPKPHWLLFANPE